MGKRIGKKQKEIAMSLTLWRELFGLDQADLARATKISPTRICDLENAKDSLDDGEAFTLAKAYNISEKQLYDYPPSIPFIVQTNLERLIQGKQDKLPRNFSRNHKDAKTREMIKYVLIHEKMPILNNLDGVLQLKPGQIKKYKLSSWLTEHYQNSVSRMIKEIFPEKVLGLGRISNQEKTDLMNKRIDALREYFREMDPETIRGLVDKEFMYLRLGSATFTHKYHESPEKAVKELAPHLPLWVLRKNQRLMVIREKHQETIKRFTQYLAGIKPDDNVVINSKYCQKHLGVHVFKQYFGLSPVLVAEEIAPHLAGCVKYSPHTKPGEPGFEGRKSRRKNAYHPATYRPRPRILNNQTINIAELVRHYSHIYTNLPSKASQERRIALAKSVQGLQWLQDYPSASITEDAIQTFEAKHGNYLVAVMVRIGLEGGFERESYQKNFIAANFRRYLTHLLRCSDHDPDAHLPSDTNRLFVSERGRKRKTYRSISL